MVERATTHIARKAEALDIVLGRSPISVAAASIYLASQASDGKSKKRSYKFEKHGGHSSSVCIYLVPAS